MRIPLLFFYLLFLATLYGLARRWLSPFSAAVFGLSTLGWGLTAYFAALPSWYLMFFAGYGTFFLMKHIETGRMRWLFLAGISAGISICIKILGIYFIFAGMILLMYRESALCEPELQPGLNRFPWLILALKSTLAAAILLVLTAVLWRRLGVKEFLQFLFPASCVMLVPLISDSTSPPGIAKSRIRRLLNLEIIFLGGAAVPVILFAAYFLKQGALVSLYLDLFVLPLRRYDYAFFSLPPLGTTIMVLPVFILFWRSSLARPPSSRWMEACTYAALAALVIGGSYQWIYQGIWYSTRPLIPLISAYGCFWLLTKQAGTTLSWLNRQRLLLVLSTMACVSIIQFPDSFGIYFFYITSLMALAGVAVFQSFARRLHRIGTAIMAAYAIFGLLWVSRAEPGMAGESFLPRSCSTLLLPERAGLMVGQDDFLLYEKLVRKIQEHSAGSDYIYAGPDCPQVYFLSSKKNPTRFFYDFFSPEKARDEIILKTIRGRNIKVVVLNTSPGFSRPITKEFYDAIAHHFEHHEDVNQFRIFW
jgi:hypothetical protein